MPIFCFFFSFRSFFFSMLQKLRGELDGHFSKAKQLNSDTRKKYQEYGQALPTDAGQKVSKEMKWHM